MNFVFNDSKAKHLGSGVVLFENAITFDSVWACDVSEKQVSDEQKEMYTEAIDPETGKAAFLNKSGYYFDADGVRNMPRRGSKIHRNEDNGVIEFLNFMEESKDKYLLKYFLLFPIAYKNVWWKVKGHIVSYSSEHGGTFLGSHSDTSADYSYGFPHPVDQLATRNTVSCIVYLNDNFEGGQHYFNYLDIEYTPKAGDILMFPSNYMAAHEVRPIISGSRYTYLGWYSHGSPNTDYNESVEDPEKNPDSARYATNVYMTNLRKDFKKLLDSMGQDAPQHAVALVESMHS
jgi:hypothetical protein